MLIAVLASIATEARVRVLCWVVLLLGFMMVMMILLWWLYGDLHGNWSFLMNWEVNLLLVNNGAVNWNMNWIRHWLLNDIWNIPNDLNWGWDGNFHWHVNSLLNMNWIRSKHICFVVNSLKITFPVAQHSPVDWNMNWVFHMLDDLNWIRFLDFDWVWLWNMTVAR